MTHISILEENINDNLWHKILLTITYIENNKPTKALLYNIKSQETQNQKVPNLSHLHILRSTICIFLYKEKRSKKSEK